MQKIIDLSYHNVGEQLYKNGKPAGIAVHPFDWAKAIARGIARSIVKLVNLQMDLYQVQCGLSMAQALFWGQVLVAQLGQPQELEYCQLDRRLNDLSHRTLSLPGRRPI